MKLINADCPRCGKTVAASVVGLSDEELFLALEGDIDVELMHTVSDGDHIWKLNRYEKEKVLKTLHHPSLMLRA